MGIIYLIKNKIDNKCYVGQTTRTLKKRWSEHCKQNGCIVLHNAILKYTPENFTIEQLFEGTNDELDKKEIFYQQIINIRGKIKISVRLSKSAKLFIKWMQFND